MPETGVSPSRYEMPSSVEDEESFNYIEYAMRMADINSSEAPKIGTPAYKRLKETAESYIGKVDVENKKVTGMNQGEYNAARRAVHDQLCIMLYGKGHQQLSKRENDRVSDFAAYLENRTDLLGTW